ncbi:MAG TPA: protein tyrosine phosphatase [Bacteroidia bacterium]|jgi:protein-tyrosine phosphatase|nr:protein tyrosine phosphatase [Bacteroidia bacterium]
MNILFVCSRNNWRSPTAENIYRNTAGLNVRSAGTEPSARVRVNAKTIAWAELIMVMEKKHKQRLQELFPGEMEGKEIHVLEIPDEYEYMDEELVQMLKVSVDEILKC